MTEVAKLANIHNFVMEIPDGYDTTCGEKGVQMSGVFFLYYKHIVSFK